VTSLIFSCQVYGQQSSKYFDFWSDGKWTSEITIYNNDTIPEKDSFIVQKMNDKNAYQEKWTIFIGEGEYVNATVIRAFDKETNRWKLFYVDDLNAQTWDSQLLEDKVYFFKEFSFKGKKFYSRQAWSLKTDGRVLRTIDRSDDNQNWTPRYWQIFKKVD
jgi:hypothetical protein